MKVGLNLTIPLILLFSSIDLNNFKDAIRASRAIVPKTGMTVEHGNMIRTSSCDCKPTVQCSKFG